MQRCLQANQEFLDMAVEPHQLFSNEEVGDRRFNYNGDGLPFLTHPASFGVWYCLNGSCSPK